MNKDEAIEGYSRVAIQKARLAKEIEHPVHRFMKPEQRDPDAREMEAKEKALAVLWLSIEIQETIKTSMTNSGVKQDAIENAIRLFKQEARR